MRYALRQAGYAYAQATPFANANAPLNPTIAESGEGIVLRNRVSQILRTIEELL